VDSDAIFSYQLVKRMNPETQIVTEIVNTSNISYLDTDSSSKFDNYKFSTQFAAGNLFTTSLLDSLVCQVFKLIFFCPERFSVYISFFFISIYFVF
jgi:dihydroorotase